MAKISRASHLYERRIHVTSKPARKSRYGVGRSRLHYKAVDPSAPRADYNRAEIETPTIPASSE